MVGHTGFLTTARLLIPAGENHGPAEANQDSVDDDDDSLEPD